MNAKFKDQLVEMAKRLILDHKACADIGNVAKCEMYYDILENMTEILQAAITNERAPMLCGHPQACRPDTEKACSACAQEMLAVRGAEKWVHGNLHGKSSKMSQEQTVSATDSNSCESTSFPSRNAV